MSRTPIPDTPGYVVLVGDDGKEWARKAVSITFRLNPETRVMDVAASFPAVTVSPPLKKREYRKARVEYRDMADTLILAGEWSWQVLGRKDTVNLHDGKGDGRGGFEWRPRGSK